MSETDFFVFFKSHLIGASCNYKVGCLWHRGILWGGKKGGGEHIQKLILIPHTTPPASFTVPQRGGLELRLVQGSSNEECGPLSETQWPLREPGAPGLAKQ